MKFTVSISSSGDFSRAYKKGRYYVGNYLILYVLKGRPGGNTHRTLSGSPRGILGGNALGMPGGNALGIPGGNALGVAASKKVGKSVRRNRLRRLVKENYRLYEGCIRTGFLLVFVVRPAKTAGDQITRPADAQSAKTPATKSGRAAVRPDPAAAKSSRAAPGKNPAKAGKNLALAEKNLAKAGLPDFWDIQGDMRSLLLRAGIFDNEKWENLQKTD